MLNGPMRQAFPAALLLAASSFGFQTDEIVDATGIRQPNQPKDDRASFGKVISAQKPLYPENARAAHREGIVVLEALVDERGVPTNITVVSSAGFGMDESAAAAVARWRYQPSMKNGKAVRVLTDITIDFELEHATSARKQMLQRAAYNVALRAFQQHRVNPVVLGNLQDLVQQKFAPGMYLYGAMLEQGRGVDSDPGAGFRLIQDAARQNFAPAQYEVALARINGDRLPKDVAKGLDLMRSAAKSGSAQAQFYLGDAYEKGKGVPVNRNKAREYFQQCAAQNDGACQLEPGRLSPDQGGPSDNSPAPSKPPAN